jgi:DNA repair protein RecO (recombination protein O)
MKPGRYKVRAIILNRVNYGEADLIVCLFTREFGKIKGMAKHGRKSRHRFSNVLTPTAVVEMEFTQKAGRDLVQLESGGLLRSYDGLAADPRLLGRGLMVLELVDAFEQMHDPAPELFDLVCLTLDHLESGQRSDELLTVFQLKLLMLAGFGPNLISCTRCGKTLTGDCEWRFSVRSGGVVCHGCRPGDFPVSLGTLKSLILLQSLPFDKISRVRLNTVATAEAASFLMAYIRHILGRDLKTSQFLEKVPIPNSGNTK